MQMQAIMQAITHGYIISLNWTMICSLIPFSTKMTSQASLETLFSATPQTSVMKTSVITFQLKTGTMIPLL